MSGFLNAQQKWGMGLLVSFALVGNGCRPAIHRVFCLGQPVDADAGRAVLAGKPGLTASAVSSTATVHKNTVHHI